MFNPSDNSNVLKALPYCVHLDDTEYMSSGCPVCPFSEDCPRIGLAWMDNGLIRILSELPPSCQRDHFIHVLSSCSSCERECSDDCPYYSDFGEENIAPFYREISSFLTDAGIKGEIL